MAIAPIQRPRTSVSALNQISLLETDLSDSALLALFVRHRDETAFAALVQRHGSLVTGVALRILGDASAAEDVFQATFLLLARKAPNVSWGHAIGPWLHAVAFRLSCKARSRRRMADASSAALQSVPDARKSPSDALVWREVCALIDEELNRLPRRLRAPLVLCYLEGYSRDDAARQLGWSLNKVKYRLEVGRERLRARLTRRGLALAGAGIAALLAEERPALAAVFATAQMGIDYARTGTAPVSLMPLLNGSVLPVVRQVSVAILLLIAGLGLVAGAWWMAPSPIPDEEPAAPVARSEKNAVDANGDPLPQGAIMRLGTSRLRPGGYVHLIAFSPDAKQLATWHQEMYGADGLTIWDAQTGQRLRRVDLPGVKLRLLSWLADGRGVAIANSNDGPVVWEFTDENSSPPGHKPIGQLGGRPIPAVQTADERQTLCFAVSPDGKLLLAGNQQAKEQPIQIWDLVTQRKVSALPKPRNMASFPKNCDAILVTPDSKHVIAAGTQRSSDYADETTETLLVAYDIASGRVVNRLTVPASLAQWDALTFAVSNTELAIGHKDEPGTVVLWRFSSGRLRSINTKPEVRPNCGIGVSGLAFSSDGKTLVTIGNGGSAKSWDAATGRELWSKNFESRYIYAAPAISRDGKLLAHATDGMVCLRELATGKEAEGQPGHTGPVAWVRATPDGRQFLTGSHDGNLRIWDATSSRIVRTISLPTSSLVIPRGELMADGHTVATNAGGRLRFWDVADGRETHLPELTTDVPCAQLSVTPDGRTIVVAGMNKVTLVNWPSGKIRMQIALKPPDTLAPPPFTIKEPPEIECDAATLSPAGHFLVTLTHQRWHRDQKGRRFGYAANGALDLWNAATGAHVHRLVATPVTHRSVLFTPSGDLLFLGSGPLRALDGTETPLASGIHIIDPLTGRLRRSFGQSQSKTSIVGIHSLMAYGCSRDGRTLYCGGIDGYVYAFETVTGGIRRELGRHHGWVYSVATTADSRRLMSGSNDLTALVWDISLTSMADKNAAAPSPEEQAKLWAKLLESDAKTSYEVMAALAAQPKLAIALIRQSIKPVTNGPTDQVLAGLVADLGNEKFSVREKAYHELDQFGESAISGLMARLPSVKSAEVKSRLARLIDKHNPTTPSPQQIRETRALEILEQINTFDARELMSKLAGGVGNVRLTVDAAESLKRMRSAR